ncbi:MAG TPA: methyltransferase domain-containing protein [Burkholderiaceae bacterium]|nr:methyltransferase domain-containing protein [Burkholderiaceae bacterium]
MSQHASVAFFDTQFQRQIAQHEFALNPFEQAALPHVRGRVLDFGCGMGNLALHAARAGHEVQAYDASPAAIAHLQQVARDEGLPLQAAVADLREMRLHEQFDTVVCIGLLMFFECPTALSQLAHLQSLLRPGGVAVVNVLTEGTTYMDMFSPEGHCLFKQGELLAQFDGWRILAHEQHSFPAPGGTVKAFDTVIAQRA